MENCQKWWEEKLKKNNQTNNKTVLTKLFINFESYFISSCSQIFFSLSKFDLSKKYIGFIQTFIEIAKHYD